MKAILAVLTLVALTMPVACQNKTVVQDKDNPGGGSAPQSSTVRDETRVRSSDVGPSGTVYEREHERTRY